MFAALSFVVSAIKGFVPIYLLESTAWVAAAIYWQVRTTHSKTSEILVISLAFVVSVGEIAAIAFRPPSLSHAGRIAVGAEDSVKSPNEAQTTAPALQSCPRGFSSEDRTIEISPTQVEGTNAEAWYVAPGEGTADRGHWYFHFTLLNKTSHVCVTAIHYEVQLESNGAIIHGHGEKHISPLSPSWSYTPQEADPDDELQLASRPKTGTLNSWKITKVLGFIDRPSN